MNHLSALPKLAEDEGRALTAAIRAHLDTLGLTRNHDNHMNGAENTGWTEAYGSTGFSVSRVSSLMPGGSKYDDGYLSFHVVISGKSCGVRYRRIPLDTGDDTPEWGHEPVNAETLYPRFKRAFEALGFEVAEVRYSGAQMLWDDDVEYNVVVKRPEVLGPPPQPPARRRY